MDKSSQEALQFAKSNQDAFNRFERSTTAAFSNAAKGALGAVAAFASVSTVVSQLRGAFDFADQINDTAKANEVLVGTVLKLSNALSLNGGNANDATKVFDALTNSIDAAAQGSEATQQRFARLGITLEDLRTLDGQQIFDKTLQGLAALEDPIERNAAKMDLLGKATKGVDISGLANDYTNNQESFEDAEKSFATIGDAMDRLDSVTFKAKQTLAEDFGPVLLKIIEAVDVAAFGFERLEKNIAKAANAQSTAKWQAAPRLGEDFKEGQLNLPEGFSFDPKKRDVIDKAAEQAKDKADKEARKAREDAEKKAHDAEITRRMGASQLYWETEARMMEEKLDRIIKTDKVKANLEKEDLERQQKYMAILQDQANKNFDEAQRAENEAAEEFKRNQEQNAREISQAFTNGLFSSFREGESFGKAMLRNIVALGQTWFARLFQSFVTSGTGMISSLVRGSSGASLVPTASGANSVTGLLGGIKGVLGELNGGITGAIEQLGVFLSDGPLADIGGLLGEYAGEIATGFSYFGAALQLAKGNIAGAALTAVGTFFGGPIGGAIGGLVGSLFGGGSLPPRVTQSRVGSLKDGVFSAYEGVDPGKRKLGLASPLDQINEQFVRNIDALLKAYDADDDVYGSALITQKKNLRARYAFGINGTDQFAYEESFGEKGTLEQAFASLVENVFGQVTAKAIQASSLPDGIKKFFDGLTKKEDVTDAINSLISFKAALVDLPDVFNAIQNAIDTTDYKTSIVELKARFSSIQTYTSLFYTEQENFATFTSQLNTQFDALNASLPATRDGFRALVDGIEVVDKKSSDQFNGLVALAPAMDEYFKQLEQQKDIVESTTGALRDLNSFTSLAEYRQYKGVSASYGATLALDNTANLRAGRLGNNTLGQGIVTSTQSTEVVSLLKEVRDYIKQNAKAAADGTSLLETFNVMGIPTRA